MNDFFKPEDIKVFNPKTVIQDMLDAKEGTVFILGDKHIKNPEGDDTVEMTFVQIQKVRDNRGYYGIDNRTQAINNAPNQPTKADKE